MDEIALYSLIYLLPGVLNFVILLVFGKNFLITHKYVIIHFLNHNILKFYFPFGEVIMVFALFSVLKKMCKKLKKNFEAKQGILFLLVFASLIIFEGYVLLPWLLKFFPTNRDLLWAYLNIISFYITVALLQKRCECNIFRVLPLFFWFSLTFFVGYMSDMNFFFILHYFLLISLCWTLSCIVNDIVDRDIDEKIHPERLPVFSKGNYVCSLFLIGYLLIIFFFSLFFFQWKNEILVSPFINSILLILIISIAYSFLPFPLREICVFASFCIILYPLNNIIDSALFSFILLMGFLIKDYRDAEGDKGKKVTLFTYYPDNKRVYRTLLLAGSFILIFAFIYLWQSWTKEKCTFLLSVFFAFLVAVFCYFLEIDRKKCYNFTLFTFSFTLITFSITL